MDIVKFSFDCTACESCCYVCPNHAISFVPKENGYKYPVINYDKCINCGLCSKNCAIYHNPELIEPTSAFLYRSKNNNTLQNSSSGGFAHDLSLCALEQGFDVYGVRYDAILKKAVHDQMKIDTIDTFSKSKYSKAMIGNLYKDIKKSISDGNKILCFGLPCENFAIRKLFANYSNEIIFVDLLCGGAVNDEFLSAYISEINRKFKKKIINIDFRDKTFGSEILCTKIYFEDGSTKILNKNDNCYITLLGSKFVRPSCFACKMGYLASQSDLKIGDYFGNKERGSGLSVVLKYTHKSLTEKLFHNISSFGDLCDIDEPLNDVVVCRSKKGKMSDIQKLFNRQKNFYNDYLSKTLCYAIKKHVISNYSIKQKIYYYLPYWAKKKSK